MPILLKASAAAFGLSVLAAAAAISASAAPIAPHTVVSSGVEDGVIAVRTARKKQRIADEYVESGPGQYGYDNVGSIGYDGSGYGYNRISGQRYYKCMEDLGYGRVRPCDAGGTQ